MNETPDRTRSTKQIARDALKAAKAEGVIRDFAVRDGGRATIYPAHTRGKYYTTSTLDTLAIIEQIRFEAECFGGDR
jgi:hypothetical protein